MINYNVDSGYLTREQLLAYTDTTGMAENGNNRDLGDTALKFYRLKDGYLSCVKKSDSSSPESLELIRSDARWRITSTQTYYHYNYCKCWNGEFGFGRIQDYFYVRICGTGTNLTTSELYILKAIVPQTAASVKESVCVGWMDSLISYQLVYILSFRIKDEKIHATYVVEEGNKEVPAKEVERFEVNYKWKNNAWVTDDIVRLAKYF